ncbi:MAG: cation diffusion facilitator family transporter [Trueperaceae bacterium]|nr:cation diffusion facilitator family transporter [Trueperaceae bacterium]
MTDNTGPDTTGPDTTGPSDLSNNDGDRLKRRTAQLSLGVALLVLGLKFVAFLLTGSVALLADAAESVVNVVAGVSLWLALRLASRPPDYEHPYGHHKAEYLSSAFEGSLILIAAGMILLSAGERLLNPSDLSRLGLGTGIALVAAALNGGAAIYIRRVARRENSAALAANARHLLVDVWTSLGVVTAVLLVGVSGWWWCDPLVALLVGLNIAREGYLVVSGSISQLLDTRLPDAQEQRILDVLDDHPQVLGYHRLRTRQAGAGRFAEIDIFVAPDMTVRDAHALVVTLEDEIIGALPGLETTIHVEPYLVGRREGAHAPKDEFVS